MSIIDLLFPKYCLECGLEGCYICRNCIDRLPTPKPVCPNCGRASIDGMTHTKCKKPLGLDGIISIWPYKGVIRKALIKLKYGYAYEIAKDIASCTCGVLKSASSNFASDNHLLVPIPTHWLRKNWRGFNQTEEIGKLISRGCGWRYLPDVIIKEKNTLPQTNLKEKERRGNLRGAFSINPEHVSLGTSNLSLIVFDDVWTTGSTVKEAAKVLKRNGFPLVWGLTIAKSI